VVLGLVVMKSRLQYDLMGLLKACKFTKKMYDKTKKLAFTSIFLTFCWILYYELDTFAIAKLFGVHSIAIYAIGLTIITYFRSIFGIIFTPFIARFNHFIGAKDSEGLKLFFVKVVVLFLPITIFPVITIYLTVDNFILSWLGEQYFTSISIAGILVLSYVFSFLTYPSGILILANERVKAMYFTSALQPLIFWAGVLLTKDILGLQSFAYFKLLAIFIETVVYSFIIVNFLNLSFIKLVKQLFYPLLVPLCVVILLTLSFKPYFPSSHGKVNLLLYFAAVCTINLLGFMIYYFTSQVFKEYSNKIVTLIFRRA
jgi:O-antigen/teichoic acid export membrane protein